MKNKIPFDDLPILPFLIGETVACQKYTGMEWSDKLRNDKHVQETEKKRRDMSLKDIVDFGIYCDNLCRSAYDADAEWFLKIVNAKGNSGRDQLYCFVSHWLDSWLNKKERKSV